ncbi:MAG: tRNA threonylcarbamoyladenosine dehydratase [Bacteroidales bacterium]|jgi:tRNA A37 threonylcarbamoyladenosine dehydratase|nr:tRNA threonylcarbamoyladenosine dehydratase [Bacteroidales bacterium]
MNENVFPEWMTRTVQLLGAEKCGLLQKAHVLVAGLGGVGSAAAENMVRAGIGKITLVDNDTVQLTNINRQLPALHSTIGQAKVKVMESRLKDINPELNIITHELFLNEETLDFILEPSFDFVVDAIDTLTPKILFIEKVIKLGVPLASSMGSGGKTDPSKIFITDFRKTYNCRLAYLLRKKLRKLGVHGGFKVVFSTELADKGLVQEVDNEPNKKSVLGTVSYIPVIFGSMLASIVIDGVTDNAS